jgi:hypothetical protein
VPLPDFKRFCKSKKKDPCMEFCLWVCKRLHIAVHLGLCNIDNTAIMIGPKAQADFEKHVRAWVARQTPGWPKKRRQAAAAFHWMNYSPANFPENDETLDPKRVYADLLGLVVPRRK